MQEVADRVWVARHEYLDVNLGVVAGSRGLLVIDTLWSQDAVRELEPALRALGHGDVVAVVNTHCHWDHVLGNPVFAVPTYAHEDAAAAMQDVPSPDMTFSSVAAIDLGDRVVELLHPGRGHTSGDIVVRVPDADAFFAGDLIENGAPPAYGEDSFPLEWPTTLDLVADLLTSSTVVLPGHGDPVDKDFVATQRANQGVIAETIRDLVVRGVPVDEALASVPWPYPAESLEYAVRLGYTQLPRTARQLPLL